MSVVARNLINVDIYTREFKNGSTIKAKDAKELFFLVPDDLKYLDFTQPKGWGAYCMKSGACKLFSINEVRAEAVHKYGSVQALITKAEALNKRRQNKAERDHQKRLDEEKRRIEAKAAAEKARLDAIAERKRKALEKKMAAEQQARDAASWRNLVQQMLGPGVTEADIPQILADAASWRQVNSSPNHQDGPATKKQKVESGKGDELARQISP